MTTDSFFITNRFGEKLETLIRKSSTSTLTPVVILVSGIGADLHETKNSHDEIAQRLADAGIQTVQFSFSGRGKSEGNYQNMTLQKQAEQIEDVISWTNNHFGKNINIGVYAMSFGVPTTISANLKSVKSLCLVGGAYDLRLSLQHLFCNKGEYHPDGISWRKFSTGEIVKLNPEFWTDLNKYNVKKCLIKIDLPTMLIHGKADQKISFRDAQKIYDDIKNPAKKMRIIESGDHGIIDVSPSIRQEFLHDVVQWFQETL